MIRQSGSPGYSLVELMVAMTFLGIVALSLSSLLKFATLTTVKAREQTYAANVSQRVFTRLNNIPYPYVFSCDSSSASYGLTGTFGPVTNQTTSYPYLAVLRDLNVIMAEYKFTRFTLDVRHSIRDLGDSNSDGLTTDLRYFLDANNNRIDDLDVGVRYFDQNADGDFWDTYSTPEITEDPHTRLKEATLKIYKRDQLIYQESQLISWEKFTGVAGQAAGATLKIVVSTPADNSTLYALDTAARQTAFNASIVKSYPPEIVVQRADGSFPLQISGDTEANATLSWKLQTSTHPTLETCTADILGAFNCSAWTVTSNLAEGSNVLYGQATKDVYYSPWSPTTFLYDINPPSASAAEPTGTVPNLQPTARVKLTDLPVTTGRTVSGINTSMTTLLRGATAQYHIYDEATGYVTWIDSTTLLPPVLSTGSYTLVLEGGDNAKYKVRSTWTFLVSIPELNPGNEDNSAPSVSHKTPSGGGGTSNQPPISCRIFDNQSGIILQSVAMYLDGAVVVSSTTGNLYSAWAPLAQQDGGTLSYTPASALSSGWHNVIVRGSHWATEPPNRITTIEDWWFSVP